MNDLIINHAERESIELNELGFTREMVLYQSSYSGPTISIHMQHKLVLISVLITLYACTRTWLDIHVYM
jgi:hypothetical protein